MKYSSTLELNKILTYLSFKDENFSSYYGNGIIASVTGLRYTGRFRWQIQRWSRRGGHFAPGGLSHAGRRGLRDTLSRRRRHFHPRIVHGYLAPEFLRVFRPVDLLNAVTIVVGQLEVGLQSLVPREHEGTLHRRVRQAERVAELVGGNRKQTCS